MKRATFATLGCKVNQVDSAYLEQAFVAAGYEIVAWPGPAEVCVINTCTVTARAERGSRQMVNRARRSNPDALVVVTGCSPVSGGGKADAFAAADLVTGNAEKPHLLQLIENLTAARPQWQVADVAQSCAVEAGGAVLIADHVRSFLKVQEGCPAHCAYCIIPLVRGPSRSVPPDDVLAAARELLARGQKEIVLTGIHLGAYGQDLTAALDLAALCRRLLNDTALPRLRLSSLEPLEVSDDLLALMADDGRFCPHLHIPLQSGSDRILRAMRRPYDLARYEAIVAECRARVPGITIGADVLVGFPGEDERTFAETVETLRRLQIPHLHVFPYSDRPGTEASRMTDKAPRATVLTWAERVREIGAEIRREHLAGQVGGREVVLIERIDDQGRAHGAGRNYLPVVIEKALPIGEEAAVRIVGVTEGALRGEPL
ncbi:MAG TPA: tRNA (N(6)-L-threonylcarbamoyladenosine(37)-C(2))-methylthiotransferase MtaB [bacterium]|nr:tRNA (N(6)-L-threonylcarbamoyladenosine(37)-C(2))-methylthiotransferase MtaB [bacterium]